MIENKTNPNTGDQDKQLWRYYNTLKGKRYLHSDIHMLYLTLDGHDPSPNSLGKLKKEEIIKISYKKPSENSGFHPFCEEKSPDSSTSHPMKNARRTDRLDDP